MGNIPWLVGMVSLLCLYTDSCSAFRRSFSIARAGPTSINVLQGESLLPKVMVESSKTNEQGCLYKTSMTKKWGEDDEDNIEVRSLLLQPGALSVPRSYALTTLILYAEVPFRLKAGDPSEACETVLLESLQWYLDNGGRIGKLRILTDSLFLSCLLGLGFETLPIKEDIDASVQLHEPVLMSANVERLLQSSQEILRRSKSQATTYQINNIIGRLKHDVGFAKESISFYTDALVAQSNSSVAFRNLGAAYHAIGNMQMAFASYQQALLLNPNDALVYLKLAYFYEDFAHKDWIDAEIHAESCYRYYLEKVDPEDTSVLIRLGNLLLKKNTPARAIEEYNRALTLNSQLESAWFNRAYAQLKINDHLGARASLLQTLQINPLNVAAQHMAKVLNAEVAEQITRLETTYVQDLFQNYATEYDDHCKKMFYAAPRVVRQELAKIFKAQQRAVALGQEELTSSSLTAAVASTVDGSCSSYVSFMNHTLDVLDLGCGTGQTGAWMKDYARTMVGVDISPAMLTVAGKKMLYQALHQRDLVDYMLETRDTFDLVVANEVFSYIGDLQAVFSQVRFDETFKYAIFR